MWVEAIVSLEDLQSLAAELFPVRVHLGAADSDHYLFLSATTEVSLVEGQGLRLVCGAQVRWPVLGMDIPINVDRLTVMLEPSVPNEGGELFVAVQLEHADVAWMPALLDAKIVAAINEALRKRHTDLSWHFATAVSRDFTLPDLLQPLRTLSLKAGWGKVRITSEALVLVISFHAHAVAQQIADGTPPISAVPDQPLSRGSAPASSPPAIPGLVLPPPTSIAGPSPAAVAFGTAAVLLGAYFVARRSFGSRRYRD